MRHSLRAEASGQRASVGEAHLEAVLIPPACCDGCRRVLEALIATVPAQLSANEAAGRSGHRNRIQLAHLLEKHGLPPFTVLRDWVRVLYWLAAWESRKVPLVRQGWSAGTDSSVCYRAVLRTTGMHWRQARDSGFRHWVDTFRYQVSSDCRCPTSARLTTGASSSGSSP
jgi:hypothetical protein